MPEYDCITQSAIYIVKTRSGEIIPAEVEREIEFLIALENFVDSQKKHVV